MQRIVHILLHILILLVSLEVFILFIHPHIQLDEHDVFGFFSYSMDTLWKGVLSYDSYSIDTWSNISESKCFLFYFETYLEVYDYPS